MRIDEERPRLTGSRRGFRAHATGLLGKVLVGTAAAVLLVAAVVFSVMLFAVALAAGATLAGYLWWRTRKLRKRMREPPPGERVIEGEVIRDVEADDRLGR